MNTESIFPVLLELLAKSAAIALAATLVLRAWREVTAAQRHLVWFVALAIVMLLPLTRLVSPRWAIALEPARKVSMTMPALSPVPMETVEAESVPLETVAPVAVHAPVDWRGVALGCWLAGAILVLGRRFVGSWRLRWLLGRSVPLNDERVRAMAAGIFADLGIRRHPEVRLSAECRVPITWGILRPRILLPVASHEWSDAWVAAALRHESAHIRRHDYFARWMAHLACAIYWPNPFVWLLARSLRLAQEQAADDLVLRAGTPAEEYATQLVEAARMVAAHGFFARQAVAMACPSTLEHRVRAIVDGRSNRRPLSVLAASVGSLAAVVALALCAVAQLRSEEAAKSASPAPADHGFGPVVEIEAKVLEINPEMLKTDAAVRFDEPTQIFADPQFQVIMRELNRRKGVDLISSPRITTRSKQRAMVEITREFRYAKDWEKNPDGWKGSAFAVKNLGLTLEVTPEVQADGTIALKLKAEDIDLAGFQDLDHPGAISSGIDAEHKRAEPVFARGQVEKTVTLKDGETVLLTGIKQLIDGKPLKESGQPHRLYVFVTASIPQLEPKKDGDARSQSAEGKALVAELEDELKSLKGLRPDQLGEALKLLKIDDATVTRNIPLLQDTIAEDARLAGLGLGNDHPRRKALQGQEATYRKILSDQLATIRQVQSERVRRAKEKLSPATALVGTSDKPTEEAASKIIIPEIELREATLQDAAAVLAQKSEEVQPGGEHAVSVAAEMPADMKTPRITLSLKNIPLLEAARFVANLADLQVVVRPGMIVLAAPQAAGAASTDPSASALKLVTKEWKIPVDLIPLKPGGDGVEREGAKDWLEGNGVRFVENASAIYIQRSSLLIVRDTGDEIDRVDQLIAEKRSAPSPAQEADKARRPMEEGPVMKKAKTIIIPKIELREATFTEALDYLRAKAKELDPEKTGVNFIVKPGATSEAKITLSLTDVPLLELVHYLTSLANLEFEVQPNAIVIQAAKGPVEITADSTRMENAIAVAEGNASLKWGEETMKADEIRYDPATRQVNLTGKVEVQNGTSVQKAERATVWLTSDGRRKIEVPSAQNAKDSNPVVNQTVLNVKADGTVILNQKTVPLPELQAKLKKLSDLFPDYAIIVRGDERTPFRVIAAVLDTCRAANIWNVSFATAKPE